MRDGCPSRDRALKSPLRGNADPPPRRFAPETPPLLVADGDAATNVTIRFDVSTWFLDEGGDLFNPSTASTGQPNESVAEENIQNSIKAFEDHDMDGDDTDED
jgi:hypothetical protein